MRIHSRDQVIISIKDTGISIPEEILPNSIYQIYYQIHNGIRSWAVYL